MIKIFNGSVKSLVVPHSNRDERTNLFSGAFWMLIAKCWSDISIEGLTAGVLERIVVPQPLIVNLTSFIKRDRGG